MGGDSVCRCSNVDEAVYAFKTIHNRTNGLGKVNKGALVQEVLHGAEYIVSGVSRDGIYKCTAIWLCDKRSVNGADFVDHSRRLRSAVGDREKAVMEYAKQVVLALGILHGPSHVEVVLTDGGPCLVEAAATCLGGEGSWISLAKECVGYTQLDTTLSCYLRPDRCV